MNEYLFNGILNGFTGRPWSGLRRRRKFCIKNAEILSVGKIAEFAKFAGGKRRKSPDRCLFNRAKRVMSGRGLTECRSAADAGWQSSDTALPIRASLLTACPAEVLPGVLFVSWLQREFEDLLAVLIFSPVGGNKRLPTDRREVGKCRFFKVITMQVMICY